ncbi:MAG: glycosyltransferase [Ignavibacteriales bacterium]|nr:MAG: glycosyltransferase [Ignavibacteriales bacterium]
MKEHNIFDIKVNEITFQQLLSIIENVINLKKKIKICYTNPHLVRLCRKQKSLNKVLNDFDINHIDGTGLKIAFRLLEKKLVPSFNWTDHALTFLSICEKQEWSIFFLGGDEGTVSKAVHKVIQSFPRLKVAGFLNGYDELTDDSISIINQSSPDILWVGLGSPKQELWVAKNFEKINSNVIQCVGDIFAHLVGNRLRGPEFSRKLGFEWFFRLVQNPLKYFNRYLIGIPYFFFLILIYKFNGYKKISSKI